MNSIILRGDVYWYNPPETIGNNSIQQKMRPVVIVSNNTCNENSPILSGRYTTTKIKKYNIPTHVRTYINGKENMIICEQEVPVIKNRLREYICSLDELTIYKIENALLIQYGIDGVDHVNRLKNKIIYKDNLTYEDMVDYCIYYETHSFEDTCIYYALLPSEINKLYFEFCKKISRNKRKIITYK